MKNITNQVAAEPLFALELQVCYLTVDLLVKETKGVLLGIDLLRSHLLPIQRSQLVSIPNLGAKFIDLLLQRQDICVDEIVKPA